MAALGSGTAAAIRRIGAENQRHGGAVAAAIRAGNRPRPAAVAERPQACPELDCVRHLLPRRVIAAAARRAQAIGVGAERVLACTGVMPEEAYLAALAHSLGTSFERFDSVRRADCPLSDDQLVDAAAAGLLPLREGRGLVWIVAPRGLTARRLSDAPQARPAWLNSFRLTSPARLRQFVERHARHAIGRRAADGLRRSRPLFSNAPRPHPRRLVATAGWALAAFGFFVGAPLVMIEALSGLFCALFLAASMLRLLCAGFGNRGPVPQPRIGDARLPIYTVVCALYREEAVVKRLVAAIRALDYPGIMAQTPGAPWRLPPHMTLDRLVGRY